MFITLQNWSFGHFSAISLQSAEYLPKHFRQFIEIKCIVLTELVNLNMFLQF